MEKRGSSNFRGEGQLKGHRHKQTRVSYRGKGVGRQGLSTGAQEQVDKGQLQGHRSRQTRVIYRDTGVGRQKSTGAQEQVDKSLQGHRSSCRQKSTGAQEQVDKSLQGHRNRETRVSYKGTKMRTKGLALVYDTAFSIAFFFSEINLPIYKICSRSDNKI